MKLDYLFTLEMLHERAKIENKQEGINRPDPV